MSAQDWEEVRHQVAIAGRVTDAQTGSAIEGIIVRINDGPAEFMEQVDFLRQLHGQASWSSMIERLDQTKTARSGHFHFLDLPDGAYVLEAVYPRPTRRYAAVQTDATVSRDGERIVWAKADMALPPTTLKGQITNAESVDDDDDTIPMAEVRLMGSGERTFSDSEGNYSLVAIEYGERTVLARAQGYDEATATLMIDAAGSVKVHDFSLMPKEAGG